MKKLITLLLILVCTCSFAQMRGGAQYDPDAARKNLSNATDVVSLDLSQRIRAARAEITGNIYASGSARLEAGSAAAPAYSFSTDPDTGIYSAGADTLGFGEGGAEAMRITSGGNVLIATSTDDGVNKLQVNGFTKLGDAATGIKMKVLTGTTAAEEGGATSILHGLNSNKVISWSAKVNHLTNEFIGENYVGAGVAFKTVLVSAAVNILNDATDSENILEKPITVLIWYRE